MCIRENLYLGKQVAKILVGFFLSFWQTQVLWGGGGGGTGTPILNFW